MTDYPPDDAIEMFKREQRAKAAAQNGGHAGDTGAVVLRFDEARPPPVGDTKPERKIRLIPFRDLKFDPDEVPYIVDELVPQEGLVVVWGPSGCGKSFWAFDLAMHITTGWRYRDRDVEQGPVVYCAFEGGRGFRNRAEAWRITNFAEDADPDVPFYLEDITLDLIAEKDLLIEVIRRQLPDGVAPKGVILDTLNESLVGSESVDRDMGAYIKAAHAIREAFGCAVIIIHHCGLDETRARGHTSLKASAAAEISVKRDLKDKVVVTVEKMRDGPEGARVVSTLRQVEVGVSRKGKVVTSNVIVPADDEAVVLPTGRKKTQADIAFDLLQRAIIDAGQTPPSNRNIPASTLAVKQDLWEDYCDNGMIEGDVTPASRRKAFKRAAGSLQNNKRIGVWNGWVWIAREEMQ